MGVTKLTFDGALNSAKNDALFYYYILNKQNGVFRGLGGNITPRVSNSQIIFTDGFVSAYGRRAYVENNTSITISLDSTKYGLVVLRINTSSNTAVLTKLEGTASAYPVPTQDDLATDDGIYDVVLCEYYKTASSLTIGVTKVSYIELDTTLISNAETRLTDKINAIQNGMKVKWFTPSSTSSGRYTFNLSTYGTKSGIISFELCNNCFSLALDLAKQTSGRTFYYRYLNSDYQVNVNASGNYVYITPGNTAHKIKGIYLNY